jgi:hypothetical protein
MGLGSFCSVLCSITVEELLACSVCTKSFTELTIRQSPLLSGYVQTFCSVKNFVREVSVELIRAFVN